jgi:5-methylcytosine-specific restriction endonuclease McrA
MSLNRKGKKQSPEHAAKNRITMLWKHLSEEAKDKLRKANLWPLNPNWNNWSSFEEYWRNWTDELRDSIRSRDNYVCIICWLHQDELQWRVKKHDVHHIDYNKYNLNPTNLITLCKKCHVKTNYNREYRIEYFNDLLFI